MAKSRRKNSKVGIPSSTPRLEPLPDLVREGLNDPLPDEPRSTTAAIETRSPSDSEADPGAPLGGEFWSLQFASMVSLIADAVMLWALLWWTLHDGKPAGLTLPTVLGPSPLVYLLALPLLGTVSDRLPRKLVLTISLMVRAGLQLLCAALLHTGTLDTGTLLLLQVTSLFSTVAFGVASASTVPKLVRPEQAPRALGYGLALPRAGFFLSAIFCLLLVAIVGPIVSLLLGSLFLFLAMGACRSLRSRTETGNAWPWLSFPQQIFEGGTIFFRTPGVPWLGLLAALANFVVYPLFAVSPYQRLTPPVESGPALESAALLRLPFETHVPNGPAPQETMQLEFWLVVGVVIGAMLLQRQLRSVSTERIFAASLLWLALGLVMLGLSSGELVPPVACVMIGVALTPLAGLTAGVSMLGVPDEYRARVSAILAMLFGLGGELGQRLLTPVLARHGLRLAMVVMAIGLGLLGLVLTVMPNLPQGLRSPQNR